MSVVQGVRRLLHLVSQLRVAVSLQGAVSLLRVTIVSRPGGLPDRDASIGGSL